MGIRARIHFSPFLFGTLQFNQVKQNLRRRGTEWRLCGQEASVQNRRAPKLT
jgi:hypothetical protein